MEDYFIETFNGIQYRNAICKVAIKDIQTALETNIRSEIFLISGIYNLVKSASYGEYSFSHTQTLKYSYVSDDYTVISILQKLFGFSEDYIVRIVRIIDKFFILGDVSEKKNCLDEVILGVDSELKICLDELKDFSISKLQALLPISIEQIKNAFEIKALSYKSTVKDIKEYVKSLSEKVENKVIENLEPTTDEELSALVERSFDIKNKYDFEYFRQRSKSELIDIAFTCYQKYYELKDKKTK